MNRHFNTKQGQALALNTIVIAILVIIVLLVIIVFFTSQVGDTGDQLEQNSASQCSENNPALATLGYDEFQDNRPASEGGDGELSEEELNSGGWTKAVGVSNCYVK